MSRNSTKRNEAPAYVESDEATSNEATGGDAGGEAATGDTNTANDPAMAAGDASASAEAPSDTETSAEAPSDTETSAVTPPAPTNDELKAVAVTEARKLAEEALAKAVEAATKATDAETARVAAQAAIADTVKAATLAVAEASSMRKAAADAAANVVNVEMTPALEFAPKPARAAPTPRVAGASTGRRGRTAASAGKVLVLKEGVKTNPRREGSRAYKTFEILLNAADAGEKLTFETYVNRGGHLVDLARDIKEEYVAAIAA